MKYTYKVLILIFIMSMAGLWMISCGKLGTADFGTIPTTDSGTTYSSISFNGIDSIPYVGGNNITLKWTHVEGAIAYHIYDTSSSEPTLIDSIAAPTSLHTLTGLNVNTTYKFRVRLVDANNREDSNTNDKSATTFSIQCPDDFGIYVVVPYNEVTGTTSDFCVAKYEMKCIADVNGTNCSGKPVSIANNKPWVNVGQSGAANRAKELCESLGDGYHLITNKEWMTIARNIETNTEYQSYNWSGGEVGNGYIYNGHTDQSPDLVLEASSSDSEKCFGTVSAEVNPNCTDTGAQQRTHTLSNGEIIWDLAGNVYSWVDWEVDYITLRSDKATPPDGLGNDWREYYVNPIFTTPTTSMPAISFEPTNNTLTSTNGIGMYFPGNNGTGGAPCRGGMWGHQFKAGIYKLWLGNGPAHTQNIISFRCAYSE